MPVKTNAELDAYFNTGDQPSESNFQDLIDTIQPAAVTLTETTGTKALTTADHGFRTIIVPDLTGNLTLTLPTTWTDAHDWFHIVYFGDIDGDPDSHNLIIQTGTQNSQFFHGNIVHNTDIAESGSTSKFSDFLSIFLLFSNSKLNLLFSSLNLIFTSVFP